MSSFPRGTQDGETCHLLYLEGVGRGGLWMGDGGRTQGDNHGLSAFNRYLERIQLLNAGKKEAGVALL